MDAMKEHRSSSCLTWGLGLLTSCSATVATFAQGNLVQNGTFFNGLADWNESSEFGGWIGNYVSYAPSGAFALIGGGEWLEQTLDTTPGQWYDLTFAMAGNPNQDSEVTLDALWGGNVVAISAWNPSGHSYSGDNLGWNYVNINVLATSLNTQLEFEGVQQVAFVDVVSVTPASIPEPRVLSLLALSMGVALCARRCVYSLKQSPPFARNFTEFNRIVHNLCV